MKYVRRSLIAGALTLALSLTTFAGEMHTGITSPTPLPTTNEMSSPSISADQATEIALSLMQSILALF